MPSAQLLPSQPFTMAAQASTSAGAQTGFLDLALDPRLQRALAKRGFAKPSAVQAACVPEALAGRDIVARARTGSGKTLAYLLPALHRVLSSEEVVGSFKAIVLVPTRELCEQVGVGLVPMQRTAWAGACCRQSHASHGMPWP